MTEPARGTDGDHRRPEDGIALCLSGGGYRAMVYHIGALWRLNEAGLLQKLSRVSSVSGGSITAGTLALNWNSLDFDENGVADNFTTVVDAIRGMAGITIDVGAILAGLFLPGGVGERIAKAYDRYLFDGATLQDIPKFLRGKSPRFVINATSAQSAALFRFSSEYIADYRVGRVDLPTVPLSKAVAASSAFPPFLSPVKLAIDPPMENQKGADLHRQPYISEVVLTDGGVYDNLGLETALGRYRTLLVSNGSKAMIEEARPATDWIRHVLRVLFVIDNQVGSLRRRHLIDEFISRERQDGTYWGIGTDFAGYGLLEDPLDCAKRDPEPLARTPTRLAAMDDALQEKLINWGYAICDAALRRHFDEELQRRYDVTIKLPEGFPYERGY